MSLAAGRRALGLGSMLLPLLAAGCSGKPGEPLLAHAPTVAAADEQQATCKVAKDPLNPLIVEWPGTSKVELDTASQRGVVVVSYAGCVLKVLSGCSAGGSYEFKGVTPVHDKIGVENEDELFARLPLGVASLKGELKSSARLELEYVAIGQRLSAKPPAMLSGQCAGATHYVRSIMVGGYSLDALGRASAGAEVAVGDKGGGVSRKEEVRHLRGSGEVQKCTAGAASEEAAKAARCNAVLQLGLAPLSLGSGGAVTAAGFGEGLGALAVVPTVQEVQTLAGGAASLAKANVALLTALQAAKRADKGAVSMTDKAAAWAELAKYAGENPYKELAEKRRQDWTQAAEAEARRREQVAKVCAQYGTDKGKLGQLLALDDDVVTAKQKDAYRKELAQVYAPFQGAIDECEAPARAAAARDAARAVAAQAAAAQAAAAREVVESTYQAAGLVWQKRPAAKMSWEAAKTYCRNLALARGGWRLPTKDELEALPHIAFEDPDSDTGSFWSSSPVIPDRDSDPDFRGAWHVRSSYDGKVGLSAIDTPNAVRCVR